MGAEFERDRRLLKLRSLQEKLKTQELSRGDMRMLIQQVIELTEMVWQDRVYLQDKEALNEFAERVYQEIRSEDWRD